MNVELAQQQADEVTKRDCCIKELNENKRSQEGAYDQKDSLTAKIADLTKNTLEIVRTWNIEHASCNASPVARGRRV